MAKISASKGKKFNAEDRRQRRAAEVQTFVQATARKKPGHGLHPNDRRVDRRMTDAVRHMQTSQFYELLREGED
jgi:hypothetical protein